MCSAAEGIRSFKGFLDCCYGRHPALVGPDGFSYRLSAMVTQPVERTYLPTDGWWADLVLEEFLFLADHAFRLDRVAFHFTGHAVICRGPRELFFDFAPEEHRLEAWMAWGTLDAILRDLEPDVPVLSAESYDVAAVTRKVRWWGEGFRRHFDRIMRESEPGCDPLKDPEALFVVDH